MKQHITAEQFNESEEQKTEEPNRIDWLDALKGIGIILVILGHAPSGQNIIEYVFLFHVQLFFFAAGFLFDLGKYPTFISFVKRKVKSLLIPYVAFSVITIISSAVLKQTHIDIKPTLHDFIVSTRNDMPLNNALWFLTNMFLIEVMFYLISRVLKYDWLKLVMVIILVFIGYKFFDINSPKLPWSFDSSLFFIVFFGIGYVFKRWGVTNLQWFNWLSWLCLAVSSALLVRPDIIYPVYSMMHLTPMMVMILQSMIGIFAYIKIAKLTAKSATIIHLGKNSLALFGLHLAIAFPIIYNVLSLLNINATTSKSNIMGLLFVVLTLLILFPVVKFIDAYFPFILGNFNLKSTTKRKLLP